MSDRPVIVIGAGWAGLAAAISLYQQGHRVQLLESARQAGGRARFVAFAEQRVDNGQHIFIGAYHQALKLMQMIGTEHNDVLKRSPLNLTVHDASGDHLHLTAPGLPAPLHILAGLLGASGFSWSERLAAIRFGLYCQALGYRLERDISVTKLLANANQPEKVIRQLWEPICLATLNTPLTKASANLFLRVFRDAFTRKRQDAEMLLPVTDMGQLFPEQAVTYLMQHGQEVKLSTRVRKIIIDKERVTGVSIDGDNIEAEQVILACAPQHVSAMLYEVPAVKELCDRLDSFEYQPICTVYLQYPADVRLPQDMLGLTHTLSQWVFDRGILCNQPGMLAVVISAEGEHMQMDNDTLAASVHQELAQQFKLPAYNSYLVIREKKATFSSVVGIEAIRPGNTTPIRGLWLAGDYTSTGYPATIEGAVRSGFNAATQLNAFNSSGQ